MNNAFQRTLDKLKPIRYRQPRLVEAFEKLVPYFLAHSKTPLDEGLIKHSMDVARQCYFITGDERLALLGFFHDMPDYGLLVDEFGAFLKEVRTSRRFGLEKEEAALIHDINLDDVLNQESFRRFQVLKHLDRSENPITRTIRSYEETVRGLQGEALARAICLANLARLDKKTREKIYRRLRLDAEETLRAYAPPIWYVYLPIAYRSGLVFPPFKEIRDDLAIVEAIGLDQDLYERISSFKRKWHPTLTAIKQDIESLLRFRLIKNIHEKLDDDNPFEGNVKADSMLTIKAATEKKDDISRVTEENVRKNINDIVRFRLHLKEGVNPLHALDLVSNYLSRNGYTIEQKSHQRENGLHYAVLEKDGFLIEFQARTPELHERLERGDRYHEGKIGRRLNQFFGLSEDEKIVVSPTILMLVEARAMVLSAQEAKEKTQTLNRKPAKLFSVPTILDYSFGGSMELKTPVFTGSSVGDVVAETIGLLNHRVRVFVDGDEVLDLNHQIKPKNEVEIHVDEETGNFVMSSQDANQILPDANSLSAQSQCFAPIFMNYYRRIESREKRNGKKNKI